MKQLYARGASYSKSMRESALIYKTKQKNTGALVACFMFGHRSSAALFTGASAQTNVDRNKVLGGVFIIYFKIYIHIMYFISFSHY